jgi:hypothetical protein
MELNIFKSKALSFTITNAVKKVYQYNETDLPKGQIPKQRIRYTS